MASKPIRLDKLLANLGYCTRSSAQVRMCHCNSTALPHPFFHQHSYSACTLSHNYSGSRASLHEIESRSKANDRSHQQRQWGIPQRSKFEEPRLIIYHRM